MILIKYWKQVPDKDNTGNIIPAWKRQMLAKKAAEKARKEMEERLQKEAEEKRLQAIPQWKRQLMAKKEEAENKMKATIYTPKVEDAKPKVHEPQECMKLHQQREEEKKNEDINNNECNKDSHADMVSPKNDDNDEKIIPWRAQLRKTNSKLNLLDWISIQTIRDLLLNLIPSGSPL